ncbi:hypothetical protein AB0K15_40870 [Amycolatopsis sp. NPDC049253]|uniref:hypothetical protein n=1 Tax=Amycolatopsis sp. NPDC049253 TaxID=3155274 RepID=UPI003449107B
MIRVAAVGVPAEHAVLAALFLPRLRLDALGPALRAVLARDAVRALPVEVAG